MTSHLIKNFLADRHLANTMFGEYSYDLSFDQKPLGQQTFGQYIFGQHSYNTSLDQKPFGQQTFDQLNVSQTQL